MDLFVFCVVVLLMVLSGVLCIMGLCEMVSRFGSDERSNMLGCTGLALFASAILLCIFYTGETEHIEVFVTPGFFGLGALLLGAMWHRARQLRIESERLQ